MTSLSLPFWNALFHTRKHSKWHRFVSSLALPLYLLLNSHNRFVTQLGHNGRLKYSPAVTLSDSSLSLSLVLTACDSTRGGGGAKSHTDSHSLSLSHLLTENAIVNIQRKRRREGSRGTAAGGVKERVDVEC